MGHTEVAVQLLDKGADVNAQDKVCGEAYGARTGTREGAVGGDTEDSGLGDTCDTHKAVQPSCSQRTGMSGIVTAYGFLFFDLLRAHSHQTSSAS